MKCEKCNNNEAVFHYQSNINGEKTEYHLCADCAKEAGFGDMMNFSPRGMFRNFWSEPMGGLMSGFFDDPFTSFGRSLLAPVMTMAMPQIRIMVGDPQETESGENSAENAEKKTDNIPDKVSEALKAKRELHALKHQMKEAVDKEDFETAAELRDKIHELEAKDK